MKPLPAAALFAAATLVPVAHAQQKAPSTEAPPVIVTANPLGSPLGDFVQPADVLSGPKLGLRLEPTLGETLANETGVSSSYFGPNASRPIIRGLDGERVRILQNGSTLLDASGSSPDHAVALEPLSVDRIEVVRGPATLLYGGSAIGGVVNAIDNRIPSARPERPLAGTAQLRYGGAAEERAGVVKLDGGNERFALHVDAFKRETSDLSIPGYAWSERRRALDPAAPEAQQRGRLVNSASSTDGAAVGGTAFFDRGHLGASISQYTSKYGTVVEPEVLIGMRQTRIDVAGELRDLGFIENAKVRIGNTDYRHTEYEVTEPGTQFTNRGYDARVDMRHRPLGRFSGAFGFQRVDSRFQAIGDEAFIPPVRTTTTSAFLYEEAPVGPVKFSAGARIDGVRLSASELLPGFSPAETRSYTPASGSLGALLPLSEAWAVAGNFAYTERAPNYAEVFANGPHIATNQFEVGNRNQRLERSNSMDLSLRRRTGFVTGSVGVFAQRFGNFIALLPTGTTDPGSGLDIFRFEGVRADFRGVEADARLHLREDAQRAVHVDLRADYTRAQNLTLDQPLPRIAPLRVSAALQWQENRLGARAEVVRASAQDRVAGSELPTDAYTLVNARVTYVLPVRDAASLELFLRATNLLDEEVRLHTSSLKDIAPLGGRAFMVGVTGAF